MNNLEKEIQGLPREGAVYTVTSKDGTEIFVGQSANVRSSFDKYKSSYKLKHKSNDAVRILLNGGTIAYDLDEYSDDRKETLSLIQADLEAEEGITLIK